MKRTLLALLLTACLAVPVLALVACDGPGSTTTQTDGGQTATSTPGDSQTTTGNSAGVGGNGGGLVPGATSIPPGRSFAEGGGGPLSYTFREEWRRASEVAKQWRSGAFLVTASGRDVNDEGVPSSWTMMFVDAIPTDEILFVTIDPWGKVTKKETIKTAERTDQLQPGDDRIPFGILDSDMAVAKGKAALAAGAAPVGGNARLLLSFARDDTGPYWNYVVEAPNSRLATARINARTGETKMLGQ